VIAAPAFRHLVHFEIVRRIRSRSTVLGVLVFTLAAATFRVLRLIGRHDSLDGLFLVSYLAALVFILRFDLVEDRGTCFDEALTSNGTTPRMYVAAKLTVMAGTLALFTLACLMAAITFGGTAPHIAVAAAAQGFLVAWLLSPIALLVESASEIRLPAAVAYLFAIGALWAGWRTGHVTDVSRTFGLAGRTSADLARLFMTDLLLATPALLLTAWVAVARRLEPVFRSPTTGA
jgi:hypothetical protein